MALPDGSMVLICPVGPEFSQVGDDQFDAWNTDPYYHVEEVSEAIFGKWYSNIKRVTTNYTVNSSEDGTIYSYASNGIQWRLDRDTGIPVEANTGNHPFPKLRDIISGLDTPYTPQADWLYFNEEYPTDAYAANLPDLFIHRDKFYFVTILEIPDSSDHSHTAVITGSSFTLEFVDTSGSATITSTYTITIDQLFYP